MKKKNPALKLHANLPCEGQESKWSVSAREIYHSILEQADEVVYVGQEYSRGCMLERNRYMVDHSALLIAVYDGVSGGTRHTLGYAIRQKVPFLDIPPVVTQ